MGVLEETRGATEPPKRQLGTGYLWLTRGIACLLIFAAGTKTWQLATSPSLGEGLLHARWFNIFVVEFELAFAIWLLFGMLPRVTYWATVGLFTNFAVVSLYKGLSGEVSCGCFGAVQVNPWLTTTLDVVIVVALLCCWKSAELATEALQIKKVILATVLWSIVASISLHAFYSVKIDDLSALGTEFIGADGRKTILLEPEKWSNGEFPILQYIEPKEVRALLKTGDWMVVLYRHDCSQCEKTISELKSKGASKVVCVEVPPYGESGKVPAGFVCAKLKDTLLWFVETPVVISDLHQEEGD
jgi:uncharacterized membrane protein YphA (DoxX/SURF4 family)